MEALAQIRIWGIRGRGRSGASGLALYTALKANQSPKSRASTVGAPRRGQGPGYRLTFSYVFVGAARAKKASIYTSLTPAAAIA